MTDTAPMLPTITGPDAVVLAEFAGRIAVSGCPEKGLSAVARRLDRLTKGALSRAVASPAFARLSPGEGIELAFPAGLAATAVHLLRLAPRDDALAARRAGATAGKALTEVGLVLLAGPHPQAANLALGLALGAHRFTRHQTADKATPGPMTLIVTQPDAVRDAAAPLLARASGIAFTRDLVAEPANVLTTTEMADRLTALADDGVEVEILGPDRLEAEGFRLLLAVGQGSPFPTQVVVMRWQGGAPDAAPLVVAGKGVMFDTGGVSMKGATGMEDMTMDMGGAAVVAGLMRTLARRRAPANVVGIVGLVENATDGRAQRPGDVVRSLKGDTVEVINTDAEGRLVLADVLWYAQERFAPAAVIDLATLTGAIIVALGHEKAGLFASDDGLADALLAAAASEGEGLWRMPLGAGYDAALKSQVADMRNVGGRPGGASIAAQFIKRFVKDGTPWAHLDIAGVARRTEATPFARRGSTGWGVATLDRLVATRFETP